MVAATVTVFLALFFNRYDSIHIMNGIRPPVILYDNKCNLCTRFAHIVNWLARGNLSIAGHYTAHGNRIRSAVLDSSATEMFWVVGERKAYGGRAALLPLVSAILTAREGLGLMGGTTQCTDTCSVFVRSASILSRSRKMVYEPVNML